MKAQYELLAGNWPAKADELVLVLDDSNEIPDTILYQLGLLPPGMSAACMRGRARTARICQGILASIGT